MTLPPPPKTPNIWKTLAIVLLAVLIIMGAIVGILSTNLLSTNQGTGTNNQVKVSGNVPDKTSGTLYFTNLNDTFQTSTSITNSKYSVLLVGGQSYAVSIISGGGNTIDGQFFPYKNYNVFYVPLGVSTFTENLVSS